MKDYEKAVKHPSHYTEGRKFEPKDVIRDWKLNFNLGSALKYVARAGRKDDIVQDLKKAQEYLQFEVDAIEAERPKEAEPPIQPKCKCSTGASEGVGYYIFSILDMTARDFVAFINSHNNAIEELWRAGSTSYRIYSIGYTGTTDKIDIHFTEELGSKRKGKPNTLTVILED